MTDLDPLTRQHSLIGDKYRLGEILGTGGVGTVYRATHIWTERTVAVKLLDPRLPHFDQLRQKFLTEARAAVQLHHPNVVDVLDMGEDDPETVYLVMELLEGPTLRDVLLDQGCLSPEIALAVLSPLIDALEKAHELGIVHRDFKPENIMLSLSEPNGITPKLLDFGVAEVLQRVRSEQLVNRNDVVVGTPQYMSPEQVRDDHGQIGPHTDVWGVGVVWYECLTGRSPFDRDEVSDIFRAVCEGSIDFGGLPEPFIPLLQGTLHRSPDRRIPTIGDLKERAHQMGLLQPPRPRHEIVPYSWPMPTARGSGIRRTLAGLGPGEREASRATERRLTSGSEPSGLRSRLNMKTAAVGGIALALAVGLTAWWTTSDPGQPTRQAAKTPRSSATEVADATSSARSEEAVEPTVRPTTAATEPKAMALETARSIITAANRHEEAVEAEADAPQPPARAGSEAPSSTESSATKDRRPARRKAARRPAPPFYKSAPERDAPALVTEW